MNFGWVTAGEGGVAANVFGSLRRKGLRDEGKRGH